MGSHYVPRHYLRQFEVPEQPGMIWTYDKTGKPEKLLPIVKVAQAKGFYDPDDEAALNNEVEAPALESLAKLRRRELLDSDERVRLAVYVATLMLRVPRRRRKALELVPSVLKDTTDRFRARLKKWAADPNADRALVARRLAEVDLAETKLATDLPTEVHQQIRSPWPKQHYVELIHAMTWRLLIAVGSDYFVTGDSPAYFHEAYGLGTDNTEISLPLAPDVALHACRQGRPEELHFINAKGGLVKETNRRIVSVTERFVFCHRPTSWIPTVAAKTNPYLSHIKW